MELMQPPKTPREVPDVTNAAYKSVPGRIELGVNPTVQPAKTRLPVSDLTNLAFKNFDSTEEEPV